MNSHTPHHPRKGRTLAGQAARGSGALPSFVDVIIEMAYYAQPAPVQSTEVTPLVPVPRLGSGAESAASASPTPDPLPPEATQPVVPEAAVRLPYPFNLMNPADVPAEVWKQARRGQGKPR